MNGTPRLPKNRHLRPVTPWAEREAVRERTDDARWGSRMRMTNERRPSPAEALAVYFAVAIVLVGVFAVGYAAGAP